MQLSLETVLKNTHKSMKGGITMLKIQNESTEEEMIKKEDTDLEGEFYYMSTRYKSLIPLINEVKAQRGEIQEIKSSIGDICVEINKIEKFLNSQNDNAESKKK